MDFKSSLGNLGNLGGAGGGGGFKMPGMKGMPMGYRGPVRIKKQHTLGGAIGGMLLGIVLVFGSPVVLWMAESQHTAKDFAAAQQVETATPIEGYVTFQGVPEVLDSVACVDQNNCLYSEKREQELVTKQQEECGTVVENETTRKLYETTLECDEDGNCKQCYMVEKDVWEDKNVVTDFGKVKLGAYTVSFTDGAVMLGLGEETVSKGEKKRDVWEFFKTPAELRVAGNSYGGEVAGAGELTYVLSNLDYAGTLAALQARDEANKWMLRIAAFAMLFIGFSSIFGLVTYFGHLLRRFPIVGPLFKEGTKFLVALASFLLAVVVFAVMWVVIMLAKNLIVGIAVMALIILGLVFWAKKHKGEAPA